MPRKAKTWTPKQGKWMAEAMIEAYKAVTEGRLGVREAAKHYGVPKSTLSRRISKCVESPLPASRPPVFTMDEENQLVRHIKDLESQGFGIGVKAVCRLAFEMAEHAGKKHRFNHVNQSAGYDWYQGFMRRHPDLSLRKPEALSAARASMLNPTTISDHFQKLGDVLDKADLKSRPAQIYNLDETGLSLVHKPSSIVATKGKKTVQSRTSGERGENVTVLICANAQGSTLPPFIIFKGQRINSGLTANAPPGTLFGTSKSGFIDTELFETWFKKLFLPSIPQIRPVLLVLDGHGSHISISTLKLARENSVHMYCLPPHTTNHTQPLDKSVFKSVKTAYNQRCEKFMRENPNCIITRYDFSGLFTDVYHKVFTMANIISGFRSTGIYPFNPLAITPEHLQFSSVETKLTYENNEPTQEEAIISMPVILEVVADVHTNPEVSDPPSTCIQDEAHPTIPSQPQHEAGPEPELMDIDPGPSTSNAISPPTSTLTRENNFSAILKKPLINKVIKSKHTSRVTEARCLTSDEVFNYELAKQTKKDKEAAAKEERKMEREKKKKQREQEKLERQQRQQEKRQNKETSQQKKQKRKDTKNNNETPYVDPENTENYCGHCGGFYTDDDEEDKEDWWQCIECKDWFHESCTGLFGRTNELCAFTCVKCKN